MNKTDMVLSSPTSRRRSAAQVCVYAALSALLLTGCASVGRIHTAERRMAHAAPAAWRLVDARTRRPQRVQRGTSGHCTITKAYHKESNHEHS
jgi:hypothetical protein